MQHLEKGGCISTFGDLTMHIGVGIDSKGRNDYLTWVEGDSFVWTPVALKKLEEYEIAGASDLQSKQLWPRPSCGQRMIMTALATSIITIPSRATSAVRSIIGTANES